MNAEPENRHRKPVPDEETTTPAPEDEPVGRRSDDLEESEVPDEDEVLENPPSPAERAPGGEQRAEPLVLEFVQTGQPERLDIFLAARVSGYSRSYLQALIEDGCVTLAPFDRLVKPAVKVPAGVTVRIAIPAPKKLNLAPLDIPIRVVYEDPYLAVIDKPGNLAVHPSPDQSSHTLVNALLHHLKDLSSIAGVERPGIVHRLDKETSGVIVIAKNDHAHQALARQFKERNVHKTYVAIVRGQPADWEGRIDLPIGKSYTHSKKQAIRMDGTGKEAVTDYRVLEKYHGYALLEVYPHTGRTHQIRVHLLRIQLPIACDKLYGREKRIFLSDLCGEPRRIGETPLLERQALHAASIRFRHPATFEELVFSAPLHEDMVALLKALDRHRALGR